jgi:hypothetical protein
VFCAAAPAADALEKLGYSITRFTLDSPSIEKLAKRCEKIRVVITDLSDPLAPELHQKLATCAPQTLRIAYYDNPEQWVPGGYSGTAAKVAPLAHKILCANTRLAAAGAIFYAPDTPLRLPPEKVVGLGYYPLEAAEALLKDRSSPELRAQLRKTLFTKLQQQDAGQRIIVYLGANHIEYFERALPLYIGCLRSFPPPNPAGAPSPLFLFQQHPGAKLENRDAPQIPLSPSSALSPLSSDEALRIADIAVYFQTSLGPQCAYAGVPTIQVSNPPYPDLLVRANIAHVSTDPATFRHAVYQTLKERFDPTCFQSRLRDGLGLSDDWPTTLMRALLDSKS